MKDPDELLHAEAASIFVTYPLNKACIVHVLPRGCPCTRFSLAQQILHIFDIVRKKTYDVSDAGKSAKASAAFLLR